LGAAVWWARDCKHIAEWAVVKSVVKGGTTLNVDQLWSDEAVVAAGKDAAKEGNLPGDWTKEDWRCYVGYACLMVLAETGVRIDSVCYFENVRELQRPVRALCVKTLENIKRNEIIDMTEISPYL